MKAEETKDQEDPLEEEHRWDGDTAYVKQQFIVHYGGEDEWNVAVKVLPGELDHEEEHYLEKRKAQTEKKTPAPVPIQKSGSFFGAQTYNDTTTVAAAPSAEPHSFFGAQTYNDGTNPTAAASNVSSPGANLFGAALGSNSTSSSSSSSASSSSTASSFLNEYAQEKNIEETGATHHHRSLFSDPEEEDDMFGALGGGGSSSSNNSSIHNNKHHSIFSDPEEEDDMFGAIGGSSSASSKARKGSFFGAQTYNDAPKSSSLGSGGTASSGGTTSTHTSRTPSFFGTDNGGLGGLSSGLGIFAAKPTEPRRTSMFSMEL
jgi:hypothetical protein